MSVEPGDDFARRMLQDCRRLVARWLIADPQETQLALAGQVFSRSPLHAIAAMACVASARDQAPSRGLREFPYEQLVASLPTDTDRSLIRSCLRLIKLDARGEPLPMADLVRVIEAHGLDAFMMLADMAVKMQGIRDQESEPPLS